MKLFIYIFLTLTFLIGKYTSFAQNLVVNGDFSVYLRCPQTYNHYSNNIRDLLPGWNTVNRSTPDFFHRCSQHSKVGVPENFAGTIEPIEGDGYIGLILRADKETYHYSQTYSEHITGVFTIPLESGKKYCFTMHYAFAGNSGIAANGLGVYFSEEIPVFSDIDDTYTFIPQLMTDPDSLLYTGKGWKKLSATFHAKGNERYLTIGNFLPFSKSIIVRNNPEVLNDARFFAYYYIDAVSCVSLENQSCDGDQTLIINSAPLLTATEDLIPETQFFEAGKTYTLKNVYFDFEKADLKPESFSELNNILNFLNENDNIHIRIIGHTDNTGSVSFNKLLSETRAKAVFEYFFHKGIAISRMTFSGIGSSFPVAGNETEYGRQLNRRVEIEFYLP
jgi:OmpA-OmpF porin, OOP family